MLEQALLDLLTALKALIDSLMEFRRVLENWKSRDWPDKMKKAQKDVAAAIKTTRAALNDLKAALIKFQKDNAGQMDDAALKKVDDVNTAIGLAERQIKIAEEVLKNQSAIIEV